MRIRFNEPKSCRHESDNRQKKNTSEPAGDVEVGLPLSTVVLLLSADVVVASSVVVAFGVVVAFVVVGSVTHTVN